MLRKFIRYIYSFTRKPYLERKLLYPLDYRYRDIRISVQPGVFHPGYFYSTKFLLDFFNEIPVKGKRIMEMGCGTGLVSIVMAKRGALVTAADHNREAVKCAEQNRERNSADVEIYQSDLFENLPPQKFDFILFNPPYYKGKAVNAAQEAWYYGENLDLFRRFFSEAGKFLEPAGKIFFVVSDAFPVEEVNEIAVSSGFLFSLERKKIFLPEDQFIYSYSAK